TATPRHQASATTRLPPIFVPVSSPRSVSLTGVNGSYSENQRMPAGSDAVGTKPLLRKGRSMRNIGELLAVSTLLADSPRPTQSHVIAKVSSRITPTAANHSAAFACGRKPTASAVTVTTATLAVVWIVAPTTCPVRTDERATAMV